MKRLCLTLITLSCAAAALPAQTLPDSPQPAERQPSDSSSAEWNNVAGLAHDEEIVVKTTTGRSEKCLFSGAIDTTLFCGPYLTRGDGGEYRFPRNEVEQVRLNQQHRNQRIVFWSLTAAGFIAGASLPNATANGTPRILSGIAGGAVGAFVGAVVAFPTSLLIPGKLVYRRGAHPPTSTTAQPAQPFPSQAAHPTSHESAQ
jgi:hypothetical protein